MHHDLWYQVMLYWNQGVLTSLGSNHIFRFPVFKTAAASLFCRRRDTWSHIYPHKHIYVSMLSRNFQWLWQRGKEYSVLCRVCMACMYVYLCVCLPSCWDGVRSDLATRERRQRQQSDVSILLIYLYIYKLFIHTLNFHICVK